MQSAASSARDEWLALACQRGRPEAFAELVREMERPLLYYVAKLLRDDGRAPDVLQEVWLRAVRTIRALEDPRRLRPWLYRIAHGLVVDRIRHDASQARAELERAVPPDAAEESPAESFSADDAAAVHRALDELDAHHREVLILHFLEDMPLADIAVVTGCPVGTVKSRVFYAKRSLREALLGGGHGTRDEPLRDRLLAQQEPTPDQLARYRKEVDALLERLRRRQWWADAARAVLATLGAVVLFPLAVLFAAMALYLLVGGTSREAAACPAAAGLLCLAGAVVLVRWYFRRRTDDLLLEVKRLQAQGLEFEERLRTRGSG